MAKNVTVTWDIVPQRQQGAALPLDEIELVRVDISADGGASYVELSRISPTDPQQVFVPDLETGEWRFRFTVIDTNGVASDPQIEIVTVIDDSPPLGVTNVVVTQV